MNIVYLGSGAFGIDSLKALVGSRHNLSFIASHPARPAGRGRKAKATPVTQWAEKNGIDFAEAEDVNAADCVKKIAAYKPDLIIVIAMGQKIGNELINMPPKGTINVHASLLPKYRGAAPVNWAIVNGETRSGNTIITLAEKMDAGNILGQNETAIEADETAGQLRDRLAKMAAPLLLETIGKIEDGSVVYTCQDNSKATRAPKMKKSDGFIKFSESAESLQRKIRGFWPWPEASANYISKLTGKCSRVILAEAEVVETSNPEGLAAGVLDEDLNVICGKNALRIKKLKPAGKRLLDFKDFVNGRKTCPGDMFMEINN